MPKKAKFSAEDEEKIIKFVKRNDILYNVKHRRFRDSKAKNRLWLQLANNLIMDVEVVKKKWQTMRDYFVRSKEKRRTCSTSSTAKTSKREQALSFLLQTPGLKIYSVSSVAADVRPSTDAEEQNSQSQDYSDDANSIADDLSNFDGSVSQGYISPTPNPKKRCFSRMSDSDKNDVLKEFLVQLPNTCEFKPENQNDESCFQTPKSKKRSLSYASESDTNEILREYMGRHTKPVDFKPEKPRDDIQLFFDSMASTVRKFPPLTIARIKMKIVAIIGEKEIAWAEKEEAINKRNNSYHRRH